MKLLKKAVSAALVLALTLSLSLSAFATQGTVKATLTFRDIKITLDGEPVVPTDVNGVYTEPFILDGTTYLPLRGIANALGLDVDWDGDTNTAILTTSQGGPSTVEGTAAGTHQTVALTLTFRDIKITLDGEPITPTDVNGNVTEPFILEGTTYLPLRGIANALGLDVDWDGDTSTAILTSGTLLDDSTSQGANMILPGATVHDSFGAQGTDNKPDRDDWFKFYLPASGLFSVSLSADDGMFLYLYLLGADGTSQIGLESGRSEKISLDSQLESGTYYLHVRSYHTGSYTLSTSFAEDSAPSDAADNDTVEEAQQISLPVRDAHTSGAAQASAEYSGHLGYFNDRAEIDMDDWFQFTVDQQQTVTFSVNAASDMFVSLYLLAADGSTELDTGSGKNQAILVSATLEPGDYYFHIRSYHVGAYTLTVTTSD